jgi:adenylosuccinate synthase
MTLHVVVGGQFGSEGKGKVTGWLAERAVAPLVVRVGGPNAGHTVIWNGTPVAMRQVPVGFVNPGAVLAIGAGSEIDLPVLVAELERLGDGLGKVLIDPSVTMLEDRDKDAEAKVDLTGRIGSTGKGIGAARQRRLARTAETFEQFVERTGWDHPKVATTRVGALASTFLRHDSDVIIEGTQGFGLGLHEQFYPQCTSGDCTAIDFLAQARINPWEALDLSVWVVCRTYPIRVAGNSGPLKAETTWEALGLPEELTTVTLKTRRVGEWDADLVTAAVRANGGSWKGNPSVQIYLSMADQRWPEVAGLDGQIKRSHLPLSLLRFIDDTEEQTGVIVAAVGTGPDTTIEVTA